MSGVITFRTRTQKALFDLELLGQISDGRWENSLPSNHWQVFNRVITKVGSPLGKVGVYPKRSYNFADKMLVDVVGDRMLTYAKAAIAFPKMDINDLQYVDNLYDVQKIENISPFNLTHWTEFKEKSGIESFEEFKKKIDAVPYTKSNLILDLRMISNIIAGRVSTTTVPDDFKQKSDLKGLNVVLTGKPPQGFTKEKIANILKTEYGALVMPAFSNYTHAVIYNPEQDTAKAKKAKDLGLLVIPYSELITKV